MTPDPQPAVDFGLFLWRKALLYCYVPHHPFRIFLGWTWPLLLVGCLAIILVIFRSSMQCARLAHTNPRLYRLLHMPWLVPLGIFFGGIGVSILAPGYMANVLRFRPETWPSLGMLDTETAARFITLGTISGALAIFLIIYRAGRDGTSHHEKGSARWAKWDSIRAHPTWRFSIPMRVSYRGALSAWTASAGRTALAPSNESSVRHILLVGQTGAGKGFTVFGPIIASTRVPIIYQDVKGQCPGIHLLKGRFKRDPIRWGCAAKDGWPSLSWNPMEECRRDDNPTDAFRALAAALIPTLQERDWVTELARPILAHILEHGGYRSLGELQDGFMEKGMDRVIADAKIPPGLCVSLEGKYVKEYLGTTFFSAMSVFQSGWGRSVTEGYDFSLDDACQTCTYVLSAESEPSMRSPITVFWRLLIRRLLRSTKPVPLTLLFDEALAAGKIPSVRDALATLRDRQVSIIFGTQHLSGLKEVYGPVEGESLISSFTAKIFLLNGLDTLDREYLVKALGQRTIREKRNKMVVTTPVPLITLDDLGRRASSEGVFWAIISGTGMTRTGDPIIARMVGGPKDLISQPTGEELAAEINEAIQQGPYLPSPPPSPSFLKVELDDEL